MTTLRACILGHPVAHSLSPAMHNAAFQALGIDAVYSLRDVDDADLEDAVEDLRESGWLGASVTAPHKLAVMPMLDTLAPEAAALGAVNTIVNRAGKLLGHNTDAPGLVDWFRSVAPSLGGKDALVVGAGGAARAAVFALARSGVRSVLVANRTVAKAEAIIADLELALPGTRLSAGTLASIADPSAKPAAILVNATSLHYDGAKPDVHPSWFAQQAVAIDLAYDPLETPFMTAAREAGARAENGVGMVIHQAVLAFELWTGQRPPVAIYESAVREALAARAAGAHR